LKKISLILITLVFVLVSSTALAGGDMLGGESSTITHKYKLMSNADLSSLWADENFKTVVGKNEIIDNWIYNKENKLYGIEYFYEDDDNDWINKYYNFRVPSGSSGKLYLLYAAKRQDEARYYLRVQKYYSGRWNTVWYTSAITGLSGTWEPQDRYNRRKTLNLSSGLYRVRVSLFTSSEGFMGRNSDIRVYYRADLKID
jgi:hypothetical protein